MDLFIYESSNAPSVCSECPKLFYTAGELRLHVISYSDVKHFYCGSCGNFFIQKFFWCGTLRNVLLDWDLLVCNVHCGPESFMLLYLYQS